MSEQGDPQSDTEGLIGAKPGHDVDPVLGGVGGGMPMYEDHPQAATAPQPTQDKPDDFGDTEALIGPRGSQPQGPVKWATGAMDLGAAMWADVKRPQGQGSSTPALDNYFNNTSAGQALKQFGHAAGSDFLQQWTLGAIDDGKGVVFLKRSGAYGDWQKNHAAAADDFRNGTMRPLVSKLLDSAAGMEAANLNLTSEMANQIGHGYLEPLVDAANQVRRDFMGDPDDLSQLQGRPLEAKIIPYVRNFLLDPRVAGIGGRGVAGAFDAVGTAFALTGIPQLIGGGVHELTNATDKALTAVFGQGNMTDDQRAKLRQDMEDRLNFAMMFVGPEAAKGLTGKMTVQRRLDDARRSGVIGNPGVFAEDSAAVAANLKTSFGWGKEQETARGIPPAAEPPPGAPKPDIEPSPPPNRRPAGSANTPNEPDVHAVARNIEPDLFRQYDPLAARHADYTRWINELRAARNNDPRLRAAQDEIDGILAKVNGVEDRLTNRARARIADIRGGMDAFLATDTPDMFHVKQVMLENFQKMAELQPEVQATYRRAVDQMGSEAAERGETAPVDIAPAPAPMEEPAAPSSVPVESELTAAPDEPVQPVYNEGFQDIAADVSRQAQAAGYGQEEADAYGQLWAHRYTARAARLGGQNTARSLYEEEAPRIQASRSRATGRSFAQRAVAKAVDLAREVPGFRQILPDLSQAERTDMTRRAATNLVDVFGRLPKAQEVASVAYSGRAKRGWYRNAAQAIHQLFGPKDADRFTALLSAMSPQTSVESNLLNALKTWTLWDKEGRPTDPAAIKNIMGRSVEGTGGEASVLEAWVNNSVRALTHPDPATLDLSGPKVSSFMKNLRGYVDEVTNDAWMATYAALDPTEFAPARRINKVDTIGKTFGFKSPGYMAMTATVRRAAKILSERTGETWTPAEVQETVWSWAKALYERRDRAGEDRTVQQILKAGDITHEDVAGASDFTSLLIRGVYSKILEEGGYGDELENIRRGIEQRDTGGRPAGPAVSVTGAEGSGVTQPAFERHLQQAGSRLERVREQRLNAEGVDSRDLAKKAAKSEMAANLSATTSSIPGIQRLSDAANAGDESAGHLVNLIAHDSLARLMSGIPGVDLKVNSNGGLYGGALEPSLGVSVTFPEKQRGPVLAALAKFADNFNQEQIHVLQPTIDEPGRVNTDGSYATPVYRIELKTPQTREQMEKHIAASGLYGVTFNDREVMTYYVGDPRDNAAREEWSQNVKKLNESLGEDAGGFRRGASRLWAYGHGDGATHGYAAIAGELPPGKEQFTRVPRALAERDLGHEVTPAEQAKEITPAQRQLQEHIAENYEELPDNDLDNPLVVRAYDALGKVIDRQYQGLPIKVEAWADQGPDGKWSPRGGEPYKNSAAMRQDVLHDNHLWFFITDADQYGPPGTSYEGHPMLRDSGFKTANGYPMLQNDVLRVVHDYYAHNMSPVAFGPKGEEAAWRNHMATMDDPWARWALTSETRGQNSWVNFGAHVEPESGLSERPYARQKAALLPIDDSMTGDDYVDLPMIELQRELTPKQSRGSLPDSFSMFQNAHPQIETPEFKQWFSDSKVIDETGKPLIAFHGTTHDFTEFKTPQRSGPVKQTWLGDIGSWFAAPSKHPGNYDEGNAEYLAESFTEHPKNIFEYREGAHTKSVYLSIKNPEEYGEYEELLDDIQAKGGRTKFKEALVRKGRDGIVIRNSMTDGSVDRDDWVAFNPDQIKSAVGNRGTFERGNPNILEQGANRGKITFFDDKVKPLIRIMKSADASTFLHESGHAWLEELMRDAARDEASQQLRADADTTRAWLGVKEGEPIPTAAHEKWARGFERYLMEGTAPSRELASLFAKFKLWLTRIYQTVTKLNSPIDADIRAVFDRMLSAEQPTIIAEPRLVSRMMTDAHAADEATVPPHLERATAHAITQEVETQLRRTAPEELDAFNKSEQAHTTGQESGGSSPRSSHEAKPVAGPAGGDATAGQVGSGGSEATPASGQLRSATNVGSRLPVGGEGGAVGEPVEARLARRLGNTPGEPTAGTGRGVELAGTGPQVPSDLAIRVITKAIVEGMPGIPYEDVRTHGQLSKIEQASMAAQLLYENPDRARAIAMGDEEAPRGLMPIFVYKAVEAHARSAGDWATIHDLATKSTRLDEVTKAGQMLNALNDMDPGSPVAAMRIVQKALDENARTLGQKGLPTKITPTQQQTIFKVTQKVQDALSDWRAHGSSLEDSERLIAYSKALQDAKETIESMKPKPKFVSWHMVGQVWGLPKSMLTSILHFSAPFVQGRGLIGTSYWWTGYHQMFRYFGSEDAFHELNAKIMLHPDYALLKDGKVSITKLGDKLSDREEMIQSSLLEQFSHWTTEKMQNLGWEGAPDVIRASSRSFTGYLNYIRANTFYDLVSQARARGEDMSVGSKNVRDIANFVNDFSGRGNLGFEDKYGNVAPAANMVLFTVRKLSGTINMFNPERYLNPRISKTARMAAVKNLASHIATTGTLLTLAASLGSPVSLDPDSTDFLQLKVGNVSLDLSGGSITYTRTWGRMAKWAWKRYVDGDYGTRFSRTALDDAASYFRNSMAPMAGFIADAATGYDPARRPFNLTDEALDKMVPITVGEALDFMMYDANDYVAILPSLLGAFGARVRTPQAPKDMMGMNVWGEPTGHYSSPLNAPVDQELAQLGYNMGFPSRMYHAVPLSLQSYSQYVQLAGQMSRENIELAMSTPGWSEFPADEKLRQIRSEVTAARKDAADQLGLQDMVDAAHGQSIVDDATSRQNQLNGVNQ